MKIFLGSSSPRRQEILANAGFNVKVLDKVFFKETADPDSIETPGPYSQKKAQEKLASFDNLKVSEPGLLVCADTIVVVNGRKDSGNAADKQKKYLLLGKPGDAPGWKEKAGKMLARLSGKQHYVYTGVAFRNTWEPIQVISGWEQTLVHFNNLQPWELQRYIDSQEPVDKAGAYGIQGRGGIFVSSIQGCYFNVKGFPLARFYSMVKENFPSYARDLLI